MSAAAVNEYAKRGDAKRNCGVWAEKFSRNRGEVMNRPRESVSIGGNKDETDR